MSVLATYNGTYSTSTNQLPVSPELIHEADFNMDQQSVKLRSSTSPNQPQPARVRRRSLNISHFNALQTAVSNLSRIDDFNLEELGYGFFSDVFKVTHKQTGNIMVLKRNKDTNTKMNILREVQLMNRLSHPNILKFKGVCVHEGQLHALTEYINGGDLDQLVKKENLVLTWKQRMRIALDIASGIKYLHSVGIFHRDLSAKNCLLRVASNNKEKKKYTCIVADLGLAEKIPSSIEDEKRLAVVGTPYIMAPEVLQSKPYNEKADVFSFGLLVCQLIALVSSDPEELPRSHDFGLARDLFQKIVSTPPMSGSSPSTSLPPPEDFLQLAYDCCQINPASRPSFNEIVSRLKAMIENLKMQRAGRASSVELAPETALAIEQQQSNKEDEKGDTSKEKSALLRPSTAKKRSHSASSIRLSRSFSDISRELLSHAANMVATSSPDDVTHDDRFSNPFSALKHLNGGKMKLTDEPSLALLEMTFDLATSDSLKSTWNQQAEYVRKKERSKSVYSVDGHPNFSTNPPQPPSTLPFLLRSERRGSKSVPQSPRTSLSEEMSPTCNDCFYQRALNRAMILSPLGNNLTSWWYSRHKNHKDTTQHRKQSLAGVISYLSNNIKGIRRCISLPDLSRISTLFHPDEDPGKKKMFYKLNSPRSIRSRTSNELLFQHSSKEPILEESEAELMNLSSSEMTPLQEDHNVSTTSSQDSTVPPPLAGEGVSKTTPDTHEHLHEDVMREKDLKKQSGCCTCPSSSSSSGCSSSCLAVTLHCGEVTRQKRYQTAKSIPPSSVDQQRNSDGSIPSPSAPKHQNRDSGYDDVVSEESCAVFSPGYDIHHQLPWKIPEEAVLPFPIAE